MTNSAKMSLEERLVQHIKDVGLGALIDDEDAITELTRRAVDQALFQPIRVTDRYGRTEETKDSLVVEAARGIARAALDKLVAEEVERVKADPQAMAAIRAAMAVALPDILSRHSAMLFSDAARSGANLAVEELRRIGLVQR